MLWTRLGTQQFEVGGGRQGGVPKFFVGGRSMRNLRGRFHDVLWLRFLLMTIFLLACENVWAQNTGALLGVVSDQSGATVPTATVLATNTDTGFATTTKSSAEGSYLIPLLPIGHYTISVQASGFKKFNQSDVLVLVGQNIHVDVILQVGQINETVNVATSAVNIDTASAALGTTVDHARIDNLPLNGRNAIGLIQMLPGVATESAPVAVTFRSGPSFSISGSRTNASNLMLDGTTLSDALSNTSQNLPSVDSLEEFRVLESSYSAEYGRAAGSVMLAATKSGTNSFHGGLWDYLRNDAFDAANTFTPVVNRVKKRPFLRQNQFGGDLGGPVILPKYSGRNRTFFFVSYEGLRIHQQQIAITTPLTAAERTGDFSALLPGTVITDPNTGLPFPGNIIPSNRIDTYAKNTISKFMPPPNQPDGTGRFLETVPSSGNQVTVKVDQDLGASDRLWFRYYRFKDSNTAADPFSAFRAPVIGSLKSFAGGETHSFTPNLINEFRASYTRPQGLINVANLPTARDLGINMNQEFPSPPGASVNGYFGFGGNWYVNEPSNFRQVDDKISWIHGKHSIRTGIMVMRVRHGDLAYPGWTFSFSGTYTGNAAADFLIGRPEFFSGISTIHDDCTAGLYQPFIQDDYRVSNRLTLNLGLRYDLETPWTQRTGGASSYAAGLQSKRFPTAPPGYVASGDPGIPYALYKTFKTPFAPRIGLAWDPTGSGQTSIRAAWGMYYAVTREEVIAFATNNEPFLVSFGFTPPSTSDPWAGQTDPIPYSPANPRFVYPMTQSYIDPNYRQGDTQQFNLSIQHRLATNLFTQVAYVGNLSHHLDQQRDINAAVYGPGATLANAQSRRPIFPQFYGSIPGSFSTANSNYHSLQVEVQKRLANSYTVQGSYTWSKMIDNAVAAQDPTNWGKAERALSSLNRSHVLGVNGLWDLPALKGRRILAGILGGWRLSGIVRYNTGAPLTVTLGFDNALIGYTRFNDGRQRPDVNGDPMSSGSLSRSALEAGAKYFNTAAFSRPAQGTFGNSGRNTIIGPGFFTNDFALEKIVTMPGEKGRVTFRAEAFNLMNWTNLGNPNTNWSSSLFGKIQSAGDARIVQFALRYDF